MWDDRRALIASALNALGGFELRRDEAIAIARRQLDMIHRNIRTEAAAAGVQAAEQVTLAARVLLNAYIFEIAPPEL